MTPHQERHITLLINQIAGAAGSLTYAQTWGTALNKEAIAKYQAELDTAGDELKTYIKELMNDNSR